MTFIPESLVKALGCCSADDVDKAIAILRAGGAAPVTVSVQTCCLVIASAYASADPKPCTRLEYCNQVSAAINDFIGAIPANLGEKKE